MTVDDLYIAEVASLPWGHCLFNCNHKALFEAAVRDVLPNREEARQPFVELAARSLSSNQLRECSYHAPDWKPDVLRRVLTRVREVAEVEHRDEAAERNELARRHRRNRLVLETCGRVLRTLNRA